MSTNTRNTMDNKKYGLMAIVLIMLILAGFICIYLIADAKAANAANSTEVVTEAPVGVMPDPQMLQTPIDKQGATEDDVVILQSEDIENAIPLTLGETSAEINVASGVFVWFSFTPIKDGFYKFYSSGSTDTMGSLYNADPTQLLFDNDSGEDCNLLLKYKLNANETYYYNCYHCSNEAAVFTVTLEEYEAVTSGSCGENLTWSFDDTSAALTISGTGDMTDYSNEIYVPWSDIKNILEKVIIENGVTSIGGASFNNIQTLADVTIPDSVKTIGPYAFNNCRNLSGLIIPNGVEIIKEGAFCNCTGLIEISIPPKVEYIGKYAFLWCKNIAAINVAADNANYSSIDGVLFDKAQTELMLYPGGKTTETYTIPDSVICIGEWALASYSLISIELSDNVTSVGNVAFCQTGWYANQPEGLIYLDNFLLGYKGEMPTGVIEIKAGTQYIADQSFDSCSNLTGIIIPDGMLGIGKRVFNFCTGLTEIKIPEGLVSIGEYAFNSCSSLTEIAIPDSVINMGEGSFNVCSKLSEVVLGNSLENISDSTFNGCDSLLTITLPDNVISIGNLAFNSCVNLSSVTLNNKLKSIGNNAFDSCINLPEIIIPDSVTALGAAAFNACSSLSSVTLGNSIESIGESTFNECDGIISIVLPESIISIGKLAFNGCNNLNSITLNDGLTSIGDHAFYCCGNLKKINIPAEVVNIEDYAFNNCSYLDFANFKGDVPGTFGSNVFDNCAWSFTIYYDATKTGWTTPEWNGYAAKPYPYDATVLTLAQASGEINLAEGAEVYFSYIPSESGIYKFSSFGEYNTYCRLLDSDLTILAADCDSGENTNFSLKYSLNAGETYFYRCSENSSNAAVFTVMLVKYEKMTAGSCGDNLTWSFAEDTATLTISGSGDMYDYYDFDYSSGDNAPWLEDHAGAIQKVVLSEDITGIGNSAFFNCSNLADISLPGKVARIGNDAFRSCSSLTELIIPESVVSIGTRTFGGSGLTGIIIPDSVTSIGGAAFNPCMDMTSAVIGDGITNLTSCTFNMSKNLTTVTIGKNVKYIGELAFGNCSSLEDVVLPDSVTNIEHGAFLSCSSLTSITIPDRVTAIGNAAFYNCTGLTSITIPKKVTSIAESAFLNCESLTDVYYYGSEAEWNSIRFADEYANPAYYGATIHYSVVNYSCGKNLTWSFDESSATLTISGTGDMYDYDYDIKAPWIDLYWDQIETVVIEDGATSIGAHAFFNCVNMISITIPDSITAIGDIAFSNCQNLTGLELGPNVAQIGEYVFINSEKLTAITVDVNNNNFSSDSYGVLFNKAKTLLIQYPVGNSRTSYAVPNGVTDIGTCSFADCSSLTNVTIPDSVAVIGNQTFRDCIGLTGLTMGSGVISIEEGAFAGCDSLQTVVLGSNVNIIKDSAFDACRRLTSVTIPDSVTSIGYEAFAYCYNLVNVTLGSGVNSIGEEAFISCHKLVEVKNNSSLSIVVGSEDNGCVALNAKNVYSDNEGSSILSQTDDYVIMKDAADYYLLGCLGTSDDISLPNEIIWGGNAINSYAVYPYAFCYHYELNSVQIPDSVTSIGKAAFLRCVLLTQAKIGAGVTLIDENAFNGCANLVNLEMGNSVTDIGEAAFSRCFSLSSVTIPDSATSIGSRAFCYCPLLSGIVIPDKVTTIGDRAFAGNAALQRAVFRGNAPETWPDEIFADVAADFTIAYYEDRTGWSTQGSLTPIAISSIEIASLPDKTTYLAQETLDAAGLTVKVNYADEYSRTITTGFDLDYDFSSAGEKAVTVSYSGQETSFNVTVNAAVEKTLDNISAQYNQGSSVFYVTDNLADKLSSITDKLVVKAHYADGSSQMLTASQYELAGDLSVIDADNLSTLTVTYTEDEKTESITFTVKISDLALAEWFPDTSFCSYVYTTVLGQTANDDNAGSYALSLEDISTIAAWTEIDVADKAVSSLHGIERFKSLQVLNCQNNNLAALDISGCTALQELNCSSNRLLKLALTNNTALTSLDCSTNVIEGTLDVSKLAALTSLNCSANKLTGLTVSGCSALAELNCSNNVIESALDVSKLAALTSLNCSTNQLTGLNASGCSALEKLNCSNNAIEGALDVSDFTKLTNLNCSANQLTGLTVSGCSALAELNCSHNAISGALDVSNFTKLTNLDCSYNRLTGLTVSGCSALAELDCSDNAITGALDVSDCNLESFDFSNNGKIKKVEFEQVEPQALLQSQEEAASAAASDKKLKQLNCSGTGITSIDVSSFPQLEVLNVSNTTIENLDLGANDKLTELDVSGCTSLESVATQLTFTGEKAGDTVVVDLSAEAAKGTITYRESTADITYDSSANTVTFNNLAAAANSFRYSQVLAETGTELDVTGKVIYVERIAITAAATTSKYYVGGSLATDGLVLQATCNDGTTKEIKTGFGTAIAEEYYSNDQFIKAGTAIPVTISYKGCSTEYTVMVKAKPVTEIAEVTFQQVAGKDYDIVTVNFGLALTQPSGYIIVAAYDADNKMLASSLKQVYSGETSTECIIRGAANYATFKAFMVSDENKCQPLTAALAAPVVQ